MKKRDIFWLIFGCVAIAALAWMYIRMSWMLLVPVVLLLLLVVTPLTMRRGKDIVVRERTSVMTQIAADIPLSYDKKRVRFGFFLMLAYLWLAPALTTLIPGGTLFLAAYIPVAMICVFGEAAILKTWVDFRFSVGKFWLMNAVVTLVLSALLLTVRILVFNK